jgi:hypothetical protein
MLRSGLSSKGGVPDPIWMIRKDGLQGQARHNDRWDRVNDDVPGTKEPNAAWN